MARPPKPSSPERVLLVEGEADKLFYTKVCRHLELKPVVEVAIPTDLDGGSNTKGEVFTRLESLLKQMDDGTIKHLAVIVDADSPGSGGMGYRKTHDQFTEKVAALGFAPKPPGKKHPGGSLYQHNNGLADIGLWIMPNNKSDGMLEDWLSQCVASSEKPLHDHATKIVENLPPPRKFKDIHLRKAEIATLLAWQKMPGQGPHGHLGQLFDMNAAPFVALAGWLKIVFP